MGRLKGTQTEKNLLTAFAGESQARNRYTYYASAANKEGYRQIEAVFLQTADHEKEHAKRLFKFLEGGEVKIEGSFPAGYIGNTSENLKAAAAGEKHEHSEMYPEFAQVAKKEGFNDIAGVFKSIAVAEKYHEERFNALASNVDGGSVFKKSGKVTWTCRNCGYQHTGENAPLVCPACAHPQAHFEMTAKNW